MMRKMVMMFLKKTLMLMMDVTFTPIFPVDFFNSCPLLSY